MTDLDPQAEARAFVARTNGTSWPAVEELAEAFRQLFEYGWQEGYGAGITDAPKYEALDQAAPTVRNPQPVRNTE